MNLVNIPTSNLDDVWNLVKKDISEALSYSGNHTDAQFVYETIKQNKMQLWVVWDKDKKQHLKSIMELLLQKLLKEN